MRKIMMMTKTKNFLTLFFSKVIIWIIGCTKYTTYIQLNDKRII